MAPDQLSEIRSRINPLYSSMSGTESYERRILVEEIDRLRLAMTDCIDALEHFGGDDIADTVLTSARKVLIGE